MGDRCYVSGYVRTDHKARFQEHTGLNDDCFSPAVNAAGDRGVGWQRFEAEECNYGLQSEAEEAAEAGLVFCLSSASGDSYPAGLVIGWEGQVHITAVCDGVLQVPYSSDPERFAASCARVAHTYALWQTEFP